MDSVDISTTTSSVSPTLMHQLLMSSTADNITSVDSSNSSISLGLVNGSVNPGLVDYDLQLHDSDLETTSSMSQPVAYQNHHPVTIVFLCVVYGFLSLTAFLGNAMVIWIICKL